MSNLSNNSVETVNAATTAIVTAESRVQPTSVQYGLMGGLLCYRITAALRLMVCLCCCYSFGARLLLLFRAAVVGLLLSCSLSIRDAIVTWVKKKTGPNLHNLTTIEDAEHILTAESKIVLGFLDTLVGPESEELAEASKMEDDVKFYQTTSPNVAKLFHMDTQEKRPALVMIEESEKINHFGGQFIKSAIAEFIFKNKLNLYRQRELEPTTRPANLEPSSYDVV